MFSSPKTAIVTGGATGIGSAISRYLARDGARVSVWDLNLEGAQSVVEQLLESGAEAIACEVDVADRQNVLAAAEETRAKFGPISILANNAGISGLCEFGDIDDEAFDRLIDVNLKGVMHCSQAVVDDMIAAEWGRIINLSSSSAQAGAARMVHYAATKGGVIGFTKALALELGPKGITVNNVPPGFVDTPSLRALEKTGRIPGGVDAIAETIPVRRVGRPEDIAAACAYLASEDAGYVTGHTLSVNGGRYIA